VGEACFGSLDLSLGIGRKAIMLNALGIAGWKLERRSCLTQCRLYAQHIGVMKATSRNVSAIERKPYIVEPLRLKWFGIDNAEEEAIEQSVFAMEALIDCVIAKGDPKLAAKLGKHADVLADMSKEIKKTRATKTTMSYN